MSFATNSNVFFHISLQPAVARIKINEFSVLLSIIDTIPDYQPKSYFISFKIIS